MNVSHQPMLFVRHVGYICVRWKEAGSGSVRIARISRQQEMLSEMQKTEMSPIARMEFLTMHQEVVFCRSGIGLGAEVCDVWDALLFVDYQVFDDLQVLRRCLRYQMLRRVAVRARIIHVDMHIAVDP